MLRIGQENLFSWVIILIIFSVMPDSINRFSRESNVRKRLGDLTKLISY